MILHMEKKVSPSFIYYTKNLFPVNKHYDSLQQCWWNNTCSFFHTHVVCLTIKWERMTLWSCIVSLHTMYIILYIFIYILNRSHKNGHLIGQIMIESGWNGWLKVFHRNTSIDFGNNKNTYVCISVDIMIQWYWIFYNF